MDFEQWKNYQQMELHQPSAKIPKISHLSALPGMGSLFSWAQMQELELQALIYQYMITEASVPLDLILHLKSSFFNSSSVYHYQHFQPLTPQPGCWGKYVVDPEPGRCRRTDGKKWRCSREVVPGKKYCERHVHRGRNRSRKPVEIPPTPALDIFNQRARNDKEANRCLQQPLCFDFSSPGLKKVEKPENQVLMRFFDDNLKLEKEQSSTTSYSTKLSISIPENAQSDFSLKLSTGNVKDAELNGGDADVVHWRASSIGGPLAEALRSNISTPSTSSVLQMDNGSASEDISTTA